MSDEIARCTSTGSIGTGARYLLCRPAGDGKVRAAETAGQTFSDYPPRNAGNATYHLPVYLILVASPALIRPLDRIEVAPHESDPQNTCMTTSVYVLRSPIDAPWAYVDTRCSQRSSNQATLNDRTPRDRTHSYRIYSHSIYTAVLRTCNIDWE